MEILKSVLKSDKGKGRAAQAADNQGFVSANAAAASCQLYSHHLFSNELSIEADGWAMIRAVGGSLPDKSHEGVIGMKVSVYVRQERAQPTRAATPNISVDINNNVTITVTDGSAIYYTTDGFSYPSPKTDGTLSGEQAATLYTAPFVSSANTVIMAAAFQTGLLPSQTAVVMIG